MTIRYGKWREGLTEEEEKAILAAGVVAPFSENKPETNARHEMNMRKFRKWMDRYAQLRYEPIRDQKIQGKYK